MELANRLASGPTKAIGIAKAQIYGELGMTMEEAWVPAGVVETAEDLFHDPQLEHRGHFVVLDHAEMGRHSVGTAVFRLSKCPNSPKFAAPLLGEHNEYVLKELLGMSDEEVADLMAEGALE